MVTDELWELFSPGGLVNKLRSLRRKVKIAGFKNLVVNPDVRTLDN